MPDKWTSCSDLVTDICPVCKDAYSEGTQTQLDSIKCESCNLWLHKSCVQLTEAEFTQVRKKNAKLSFLCEDCKYRLHRPSTSENLDIRELKEMVAALMTTVSRCENEIKVLSGRLDFSKLNATCGISESVVPSAATEAPKTTNPTSNEEPLAAIKVSFASIAKRNHKKPQAPKQPLPAPATPITTSSTTTTTTSIPNFNRPPPVRRVLQPKSNSSANPVTILAAKKMKQLYVGKVGPSVTEQDLLAFLEGKGITGDATAHLLFSGSVSRSFRLTVEEAAEPKVSDSSFWPDGLNVRPFRARNPHRQYHGEKNPNVNVEH